MLLEFKFMFPVVSRPRMRLTACLAGILRRGFTIDAFVVRFTPRLHLLTILARRHLRGVRQRLQLRLKISITFDRYL